MVSKCSGASIVNTYTMDVGGWLAVSTKAAELVVTNTTSKFPVYATGAGPVPCPSLPPKCRDYRLA
jgi:hypothetical protein